MQSSTIYRRTVSRQQWPNIETSENRRWTGLSFQAYPALSWSILFCWQNTGTITTWRGFPTCGPPPEHTTKRNLSVDRLSTAWRHIVSLTTAGQQQKTSNKTTFRWMSYPEITQKRQHYDNHRNVYKKNPAVNIAEVRYKTGKPSYRWQTRATRKHAKNCSNSTCLQRCQWQYWSIFIRLAVVASEICEIPRNSLKIQTYKVQGHSR